MAEVTVPFTIDMTDATAQERASSPSPLASPTLAINSLPPLDRSVSTASSVSSVSGKSDGGTPIPRRRGYMRPQATVFSASAKNRESVMSLGTIAHLQYYFARTGLLDGKGAQLAKGMKKKLGSASSGGGGSGSSRSLSESNGGSATLLSTSPDADGQDTLSDAGLVESPLEDSFDHVWESTEPMMLPPTVSTYKHRPDYVAPPPDVVVLRRELQEALEEADKTIDEVRKGQENPSKPPDETAAQGWYEIQGLHLLDVVTLAIRAAKNYYTAHAEPQRLYSIKPERAMRKDLYTVLEVLKRTASRNFVGGIRTTELDDLTDWTRGISDLLKEEARREKAEQDERESWTWQGGDWTGKERVREWQFLCSFDPGSDPLPEWTEPVDGNLPTPFLKELQNGVRLVRLHNALVRKSRRQFEEIKTYHTDTAKPYRCAENLRFWIKAAELRWETKLEVDVMGVVQEAGDAAWRGFDEAVLKWCRSVRQEITQEWQEHKKASLSKTPTFRIDEGMPEDVDSPF